jgi:Flp pilus assembly protein TadG
MSPRAVKRKSRTRTGAAAVEFAIAISVLLMIVFASIEFVRLNMLKHSVEHASYLAARKGIITGARSSDVKVAAEQHLAILGVTNALVTVSPGGIKDDTQVVEVIIDLPMSGNTWISPLYFNGTLTGRTRMLTERAASDMIGALPAKPPA